MWVRRNPGACSSCCPARMAGSEGLCHLASGSEASAGSWIRSRVKLAFTVWSHAVTCNPGVLYRFGLESQLLHFQCNSLIMCLGKQQRVACVSTSLDFQLLNNLAPAVASHLGKIVAYGRSLSVSLSLSFWFFLLL